MEDVLKNDEEHDGPGHEHEHVWIPATPAGYTLGSIVSPEGKVVTASEFPHEIIPSTGACHAHFAVLYLLCRCRFDEGAGVLRCAETDSHHDIVNQCAVSGPYVLTCSDDCR